VWRHNPVQHVPRLRGVECSHLSMSFEAIYKFLIQEQSHCCIEHFSAMPADGADGFTLEQFFQVRA